MRAYANRLTDLGHEVTSTWLWRSGENVEDLESPEAATVAIEDLADVLRADACINFSEPSPRKYPTTNRGARHSEVGAAVAAGNIVIVIGEREQVFHAHFAH
jgi:hypothetical protein